jgi:hypothetical protein
MSFRHERRDGFFSEEASEIKDWKTLIAFGVGRILDVCEGEGRVTKNLLGSR